MPIVTISSQMGSYGDMVATRVGMRLGCQVLTFNDLMEEELERKVNSRTWGRLQESPKFFDSLHIDDETIREYLTRRLVERGRTHGLVYHDFGGPFFFEDARETRHFRLYSSDDVRLIRIAKEHRLPTETAESWRVQDDRRAQRFTTVFFHEDLSRIEHYHAVYNMDHLSIGGAADSILALMRDQAIFQRIDDPESIKRETAVHQFKNKSEEEFAQLLDAYHVDWRYEPRTFPIEWDNMGQVSLAFSPDFYLPRFNLYLELTTMDQRYVTEKNKKAKKLKEMYPGVNVRIVYKKDFESMLQHYRMNAVDEDEI